MDLEQFRRIQSRRSFFRDCAGGIGTIALAQMAWKVANQSRRAAANARGTDHRWRDVERERRAAQAALRAQGQERHLHVHGGRAQPDRSLRPQARAPEVARQAAAPELTKDLRLAFTKPNAAVLASPRVFTPHGQSGTEFSDYIPHIGSCADDLCLVRSMYTDAFNHHPGQLLLFGGSIQVGRPTMGAWVLYGLGSESQNLPGFVVLSSGVGTSGGSSNWSSGYLPSTYQGVVFRSSGDPVLYLSNPPGVTREMQRAGLDVLKDLNEEHYSRNRRHGDRLAHFLLRTRLPHADGRARAARFLQGEPGDAGHVRRE